MTFVAQFLLASSAGNCPACGTQVVVERSLTEQLVQSADSLSSAHDPGEKLAVLIVDLPLSVRCRNILHKAGLKTLDELLSLPIFEAQEIFADAPQRLKELQDMLDAHDLR